jgi:NCAIR mutase (PurE)-related protein
VYCRGKAIESIASACRRLAGTTGRVVATRCDESTAGRVRDLLQGEGFAFQNDADASALVVAGPESKEPVDGGLVGLLTAGTSDWPFAAEAQLIAREAGCTVLSFRDVGVAGLHRLVGPLETLIESDVDAIIVAAGMDGVLPSVVAGLIDVPVIGLPTSTGYGHGGSGEGALTTMLQSCAPGIAVVNIDNGVGAGAMAALIARRSQRIRSRREQIA